MKSEPMNLNEVATEDLVAMLRHVSVETGSLTCLGCGHEHNCGTRGCALIREAADRLDALRGPAIIPQAEMTREEAIAVLAESKRQNEVMRDNPSTFWASRQMADGVKNAERRIAALDMALSALRPVSRELVEKVWRGEWILPIFSGQKDANDPRCQCSECGSIETPLARHRFCPSCGAPMTDEAVEMIIDRLEALKDGL